MTRLTGRRKSLLLAMLETVLFAQAPLPGFTEKLNRQSSQAVIPELELIKEEETVSIASRYEQPISQAPANVYVITDEDIRHSGATDIPTILRGVLGLEVMQTTGTDFNVSGRGNNQLRANKLLVMVDGRSVFNDAQGFFLWKMLPVTLPEIKRIEILKGHASVVYGFNAFDGVINIITKSPEEMKGTTLQFGSNVILHHVDATQYPINEGNFNRAPIFGNAIPSRALGSYNLLNLRVAYKFWHEKAEAGYMRDAEVALSAFNALNDKHKEHPLGDTIGSRVMGG